MEAPKEKREKIKVYFACSPFDEYSMSSKERMEKRLTEIANKGVDKKAEKEDACQRLVKERLKGADKL